MHLNWQVEQGENVSEKKPRGLNSGGAAKITAEVVESAYRTTVCRVLHTSGLYGRVARRKPPLKVNQNKSRFESGCERHCKNVKEGALFRSHQKAVGMLLFGRYRENNWGNDGWRYRAIIKEHMMQSGEDGKHAATATIEWFRDFRATHVNVLICPSQTPHLENLWRAFAALHLIWPKGQKEHFHL